MHAGARQTRYDGKQVFVPEVDKLLPGDILLTFNAEAEASKDLKQSKAIRAATGGSFSHALICSVPPTFVEAIGTGVSTLSLGRCFAHHVDNVRLLRWPDSDVARTAARLVQDEVGRDYSVARAVRSVFPARLLDRVDDHGTFCSALVAQAFAVAGASAFLATPVDRTTPATLERIQGLQDLTAAAFRRILAPKYIEGMSALDGDRKPTRSAEQTRISADCARQLWPQAEALAKSHPELCLEPGPTFNGLLRFITDSMDREHVIPSAKRTAFDNALARLDEALAAFVDRGDLRRLLVEVDEQDAVVTAATIRESFKPDPDIDAQAMKSYLIAGEAQFDTRSRALSRWAEWGPDRSCALAAYLHIDRDALERIEHRNQALREILGRLGVH